VEAGAINIGPRVTGSSYRAEVSISCHGRILWSRGTGPNERAGPAAGDRRPGPYNDGSAGVAGTLSPLPRTYLALAAESPEELVVLELALLVGHDARHLEDEPRPLLLVDAHSVEGQDPDAQGPGPVLAHRVHHHDRGPRCWPSSDRAGDTLGSRSGTRFLKPRWGDTSRPSRQDSQTHSAPGPKYARTPRRTAVD
jgi:hypothetical protein